MQLFPATSFVIQLAWSFISAPHATNGQTHVGCDATCPPIGYEYDSSHLCPGSTLDDTSASKTYDVCYPQNYGTVSLSSFRQKGYVTVLSNVYTGCEAGRREAGVFAGLAQRIHEETGGNVVFVSSLKGGGDCSAWAEIYENDAAKMGLSTGESAWTMPLTVSDNSFELRDHFFTPPYPHPSYMILNENLEVTYKSVGPCCGYVSYYDCTDDIALELESILTNKIYEVYNEQLETSTTSTSAATTSTVAADTTTNASVEGMNESHFPLSCQSTTYSDWSECSLTCGNGGTQFRYRLNSVDPIETRPCPAEIVDTLSPCSEQCVPEFGPSTSTESFELSVIASGLDSPRDLAFHPTPGIHLGNYSEGRTFHPTEGEELWVVNGNNHSISIVASLGTEYQTTISRRDRGYYHYMNNVTALAFNEVKSSNRLEAQDTFNFFAVCNDNLNDYIGAKEPNFFMGPTLYDTDVVNKRGKMNTVNRHGADCSDPADQCFFLHADMLHESPACVGIAHDPELLTAYGAVYWAFDTTGDKSGNGGQLVRFDFSQPHGPGSMDHSIASVRRYPDIKLYRDDFAHSHAGMIVHPGKRILFISNPGKNGGEVTAVRIDTGRYSRTAREEYPIFSNRLPSFEYSIYECTEEYTFASGIQNPSGMALSLDGERLFVAERAGKILALEVDSGTVLQTIDVSPLGYTAIGGMAVSPTSGDLYFVDIDANEVVKVEASDGDCTYNSLSNLGYKSDIEFSQKEFSAKCGSSVPFSLTRDFSCSVSGIIPNGTLFEQVHTDGYASENPDVQSDAGMDASAALLANRTDCEYDSELNFDALLLGGYFCHVCLPQNHGSSCDDGGTCQNIQWQGFTCDNEFYVDYDDDSDSLVLSSLYYETTYSHENIIDLFRGTTYRFTVRTGDDRPVKITQNLDITGGNSISISRVQNPSSFEDVTTGPILVSVDETSPDFIYLTSGELKPVTFVVKHRDAENVEGLSDDYMPTTFLPSAGVYFSAHEAFVWVALLSLVGYAAIMD